MIAMNARAELNGAGFETIARESSGGEILNGMSLITSDFFPKLLELDLWRAAPAALGARSNFRS
jgi:hypothetical protein